jgi:hypothetical protein
MSQVIFTRWCLDPKGRTPVSVDPARVDCTEHYGDAFQAPYADGEAFPAATRVIMKGKQEYVVQGALADVVARLNVND